MIETKLELIESIDELKLGDSLVVEDGEGGLERIFAFTKDKKTNLSKYYHGDKLHQISCHEITINIERVILKEKVSIPIRYVIGGSSYSWYDKKLGELKESKPSAYQYIRGLYNKNFLEKYNEALKTKRENNKRIIQKQYDELMQVFTELEYKSDIKTMKDIDTLLYCEASTMMDKIEERINKKSNPKNMRIYKRLKELRDETIITCKD